MPDTLNNNSLINRLKSRTFGLALAILFSIILLLAFYGKVISSLNTSFFSTHGDGIQSYYNSYYLARYDTSLLYSHSMNYPYGEVSCYTLSQPLVVGFIRLISRNVADITDYTVGILNALMLSSVLLATIFLYLLLTAIRLPVYLALPVSVGIAFLSPQIDRFGGHFTLSYVYAIPLLLYLLFLVHEHRQSYRYSLITGIVLFVLMTGHVYFAAFFSSLILLYWLFAVFDQKQRGSATYLNIAFHIALQLVVPIIAFYVITGIYSDLSPERPSKPYGFMVYKASPESVLLPLWVNYGKFLHKVRNFDYVQWEGIAYVGLTASLGFFVLLAGIIRKLIRKQGFKALEVTDNTFLNYMFWASVIALLFSFGVPFIFGLDFLIDLLGPFQQIRTIGRFAWLFFYTINIVVFYALWLWLRSFRRRPAGMLLLVASVAVLFGDVYSYLSPRHNTIHNAFPAWSDARNITPENQWVGHIDPDLYQAIIPLPFYHMGSDNYGITPRCDMLANSCLVSIKTGLPVMAIYLSRASVPQSYKNIALVLEPYRAYAILDDLPGRKPFLVVAAKCSEFTPEEETLLNAGMKVDSNDVFDLYQLAVDSLAKIPSQKAAQVMSELTLNPSVETDTIYLSDPAAQIAGVSFDNQGMALGYRGNALRITAPARATLFDHPVPFLNTPDFSFSFWFSPMNTDLFPKTRMEMEWFDSLGVRYRYDNQMLGHWLKTTDDSWGLVEYGFRLDHPGDRFRITVYNDVLNKKQSYFIDELLIRPVTCDVYRANGHEFAKNNRWYYLRKENKAMMEVPLQ